MQRHDVGASEQILESHDPLASRTANDVGRKRWVIDQDVHTQSLRHMRYATTHPPEPDQAEHPAVHLLPTKLGEVIALTALANRQIRTLHMLDHGQHQSDGVLGRRDSRRIRRIADGHAACGHFRHGDVVDADPGAADHAHGGKAVGKAAIVTRK